MLRLNNNNQNPKRLIVEGYDDKYSVIGLMKARVAWPDGVHLAPVYIEQGGSPDEFLTPDVFNIHIKTPYITTFGTIVDADESADARYRQIHKVCKPHFPDMPDSATPGGLIVVNASTGKKFGAWIMPDNLSCGALENFLRNLIPTEGKALLAHAEESTLKAKKTCKAPFRDCHIEKAHIYSWLAWQDPPNQNPFKAILNKALDPSLTAADLFVTWFRTLYDL